MKATNFHFTIFVWTFLFIFSFSNVNAQKAHEGNNVCNKLKSVGLSVPDDKVLVAGEVYAPQIVKVRELPFTLTESIAMVGGIRRSASIKNIHIFKCSSNLETTESVIVTNLEKVKKGIESDLLLEGGEIILVLAKDYKKMPSVAEAFKPWHCGL